MISGTVQRYLERIGFEGDPTLTTETLGRLQTRHLQAVPYENLDILRGVPLSLEVEHLYEKIVTQKRGGYCFELNQLFGWLLSELGFHVTHYVARFWKDEPNPPPKRRHHVLRVDLNGESLLCDVGVGGVIPRTPLRITPGVETTDGRACYKLEQHEAWGWVLCERHHGEWRWVYSFREEPQLEKDFIMASFWCEFSPESIFKKNPMVSIHTPDGYRSFAGNEFRTFQGETVRTVVPENDEEYRALLLHYFGIQLPH